MSKLVENILNKDYEQARESITENFRTILERKMCEMKKIVAAEMYSQTDEKLKSVSKLYRGVNEEEKNLDKVNDIANSLKAMTKEPKLPDVNAPGVPDMFKTKTVNEESRTSLVRARIRGGVVQRRKRVSNVPGMVLRGGTLTRMSAAERRRRKLGAKKAKLKTRGKQVQIQRNRKLSLMKRKRLGL